MGSIKVFAIEGCAKCDMDAIRLCATKLYDEGIVNDAFCGNCIEREKEFPTGLPSAIPVAMPHSAASGVNCDGICILRLAEPVSFRRMDDPDETVPACLVFNLAIADPKEHLAMLQNLMGVLMDEEKVEKLRACALDELSLLLDEYLQG